MNKIKSAVLVLAMVVAAYVALTWYRPLTYTGEANQCAEPVRARFDSTFICRVPLYAYIFNNIKRTFAREAAASSTNRELNSFEISDQTDGSELINYGSYVARSVSIEGELTLISELATKGSIKPGHLFIIARNGKQHHFEVTSVMVHSDTELVIRARNEVNGLAEIYISSLSIVSAFLPLDDEMVVVSAQLPRGTGTEFTASASASPPESTENSRRSRSSRDDSDNSRLAECKLELAGQIGEKRQPKADLIVNVVRESIWLADEHSDTHSNAFPNEAAFKRSLTALRQLGEHSGINFKVSELGRPEEITDAFDEDILDGIIDLEDHETLQTAIVELEKLFRTTSASTEGQILLAVVPNSYASPHRCGRAGDFVAIVSAECLANGTTLAHEIGHLVGGSHQYDGVTGGSTFRNGDKSHAWEHERSLLASVFRPRPYGDIMSEKVDYRYPVFSDPRIRCGGFKMGSINLAEFSLHARDNAIEYNRRRGVLPTTSVKIETIDDRGVQGKCYPLGLPNLFSSRSDELKSIAFFSSNSVEPTDLISDTVSEIIMQLRDETTGVVLNGFADTSGPEEYNLGLSYSRAVHVAQIILQDAPTAIDRIRICAYGEQPFDNHNPEDRMRRVDASLYTLPVPP